MCISRVQRRYNITRSKTNVKVFPNRISLPPTPNKKIMITLISLQYSPIAFSLSSTISTRQAVLLLNFILSSNPVSITLDSSMTVSICMPILPNRAMPIDHLAVLRNAVAILRVDAALGPRRLVLRRSPSQVISSNFNIIVSKLAELIIIHAEQFSFFGSSEVQAWDEVDDECEGGGHDECIGCSGNDVCDLDVQLLVVVVQPAAIDYACVDAVETDDVVCSEEGVEEEPDHSCDTVLSEHVHAVVDADPELDYKVLVPRINLGEGETHSLSKSWQLYQ